MPITNSHAIFDPMWADDLMRRHYAAQLALADEMILFGSDLMLRAFQSAPTTKANEALITILFRQCLTAADAGFVALSRGAIDSAAVHVRRMLEVRWGFMLALTNIEKWGNHIHIASLRENRHLASRLVPGTVEYETFKDARELTNAAAPPTIEVIDEYKRAIDATDQILTSTQFAGINDGFAIGLAQLKHEPPWYYDGKAPATNRMKSIRALAKTVGELSNYDTMYKYSSYSVHGTHESTHRKYDEDGSAIAPLRTTDGFRQEYILLASMLLRAFQNIMEQYRAGEIVQFSSTYVLRWKEIIDATPQIKLEVERRL